MKRLLRKLPLLREMYYLREEIDRLEKLWVTEIDNQMVVNFLNFREGDGLTIGVSVPEKARRFLAEMFILALDDAPNFQVGSFEWRTQGYEMTIRRLEGKPTAEVLRELREENERLKAEAA